MAAEPTELARMVTETRPMPFIPVQDAIRSRIITPDELNRVRAYSALTDRMIALTREADEELEEEVDSAFDGCEFVDDEVDAAFSEAFDEACADLVSGGRREVEEEVDWLREGF